MDDPTASELRINDLRSRKPGEDQDPYTDVAIDQLPGWWQRGIRLFREYDLRPYRPPRFEDGVLKYEVVSALEEDHNIDIRLLGTPIGDHPRWTIIVNGDRAGDVGHRRSPSGFSVFEMTSEEFTEVIMAYLD